MLLGSAQHPVFADPKMLGRCYDNVYHQGRFIGDLPVRGKNPTKAQMMKVYEKEYKEVIAQIENSLDLSAQGTAYLTVLMSLLNLEIILPLKVFRERCGLPDVPPGFVPQPWDYTLDGAQGLVDISWEHWTLTIQLDDIDRDPIYSQYPYQEGDEYDNNEEEMEVDEQMPGPSGDASMATLTTRRPY